MERKEIDFLKRGLENRAFLPTGVSCSRDGSRCAIAVTKDGQHSLQPPLPFIFDLKAEKKIAEITDFPTGELGKLLEERLGGAELLFSPDDKRIALSFAAKPFQLQLHDAENGKLLNSVKLHAWTGALRFSPDGKLIASISHDGTLLVHRADLSKQVFSKKVSAFKYEDYGGRLPRAHAFVGDGHLAVLSSASEIELFDTKEWKSVRTFDVEGHLTNCLVASPDGKLLVAGMGRTFGRPSVVRVWEASTGKLVKEFQ